MLAVGSTFQTSQVRQTPSTIGSHRYGAPVALVNNPSRRQFGVVRSAKAAKVSVSRATVTRPRALPVMADANLKVMIAGAPAAGKGTQCAKIVEKYGLVHISVGDLLRAQVAEGTDAGKRAKEFMDRGDLVPNEVVVDMVKDRLAQQDVQQHGWLLDGYPRSLEQAEAIEAENIRPDVFLLINVPDDKLVERVVGRRLDPVTGEIYHMTFKPPPADIVDRLQQRSDDTEEKVRNRLKTYHTNVDSVLGVYKDVVVDIDGTGSMDEVFARVDAVLDKASAQDEALAA